MSRIVTPTMTSASVAQLLDRPLRSGVRSRARDLVRGSTILVTGAGGSIGSEIVRQLRDLEATNVFLLDHDESALHSLELEIQGNGLFEDDKAILADIRDRSRLIRIFREVRPDFVFHAAAHKHLPLLERYPAEAVKTNVFGTCNVVAASIASGASHFVNVSTDKAARPTSVLGATKKLAEMFVRQSASQSRVRMASVRFGNVLGSRGSFLPGLAWQLEHGREVTVTHTDVTRFFMSIPEAAGLVVEAAVMAKEGETYVLDMGDPVRIVELVNRYAVLAGAGVPRIVFTGLRPGEKMHEELFDRQEDCEVTEYPGIWAVRPRRVIETADAFSLRELSNVLESADDSALRHFLLVAASREVEPRGSLSRPGKRGVQSPLSSSEAIAPSLHPTAVA